MDILIVLGVILAVVGVIGSVAPGIPGPMFSFSSLILLYLSKGDKGVTILSLVVFGIITLAILIIDYMAPILGAKVSGASKKGIKWSIIGAIGGILFLPPLGIFIGAFIGAVLGEIQGGKNFRQALRAGIATVVASVTTVVLEVIFSIIVLVYFFMRII